MLSHRNVFPARQRRCLDPVETDDEQLAFLPLCHIAQRTLRCSCRYGRRDTICRKPRDRAGEPPRSRADASSRCRASGSSSIPAHHPHEGATALGRPAYRGGAAGAVAVATGSRPAGRRASLNTSYGPQIASCSTTSSVRSASAACAAPARARPRSRPISSVVPCARHRHAQGLRPTRNRRRDGIPARNELGTVGVARPGTEVAFRRKARFCCEGRTSSWAITTSPSGPPRRS